MVVGPHVMFNGNCEEAMKIYKDLFNGSDLKMVKYKDVESRFDSASMNDKEKNMVLIGEMIINNTTFLFSDIPENYAPGNNMALAIKLKTKEEVNYIFDGLNEEATVHIDLGPTFFSSLYVLFTDKFGINWELMCSE
ncbi:VOC family protein [Methanobrevibacter filiformis]|uniref:PhnB-like domain-containing protein n=1 Tax=Methanobrevibacter filiformis TaxID=55758 RepID=A0A166DA46_9EURY|nr:VOC family protein [Methanobrevibacter filiformis]KZX15365.1 hypothetical protein MBFIL_06660 [Methanobrevibacter filiformis]